MPGSATTFITSPTTIGYTGATVTYIMPQTGLYDITAFGAQGGNEDAGSNASGGLGTEVGGDFQLTAGQVLTIVTGIDLPVDGGLAQV